jgi:hypothetical protein
MEPVGQETDVPSFQPKNEGVPGVTGMWNRIKKILNEMRKAMPYRNPVFQIVDIIWHKLKINTYPSDYYRFAFYKKDKSWEEKKRYIGRLGSYFWPYESIALKDMIVLTNKYIHKHMLLGMELPTPALLATVGNQYDVKSCEELKRSSEEWRFDIVIKPVSSTGGRDVLVLRWDDGRFLGRKGDVWPAERIWEHLGPHLEVGCLVERRVFNVGHTREIYPHTLNTFRLTTIRTNDGKWHIPDFYMRFGSGEGQVDNIHAGGIQVFLDEAGMTTKAYADRCSRLVTQHPDTGQPLVGFKAEGYDESVALALRASKKFAVFGTIGWDIAFTADGPVIIEGNTLWFAEHQDVIGPLVTEEMARGLKTWTAFSRFPRHHIFPALQKKSRWPWSRTRWWA